MMLFNEQGEAINLPHIYTPLVSKYFWITDLDEYDYRLEEIKLLEQIQGQCVDLRVEGFTFTVPASWFVLIASEETSEVDIIKAYDLKRGDYYALVSGPSFPGVKLSPISVIGFHEELTVICPRLTKNQLLCHPVSNNTWVSVTPYDQYNRTMKNCVTGDFI